MSISLILGNMITTLKMNGDLSTRNRRGLKREHGGLLLYQFMKLGHYQYT